MRIKLFEEFTIQELDDIGIEIHDRCVWLEDEGYEIEVARVKDSIHPVLRIKITKDQSFDVNDIKDYVYRIINFLKSKYDDVKYNYVINNSVYDPVTFGYFTISKDPTCKLFYLRCKLGKLKQS